MVSSHAAKYGRSLEFNQDTYVGRPVTCNKCGCSNLGWARSARTGGSYLCTIVRSNGTNHVVCKSACHNCNDYRADQKRAAEQKAAQEKLAAENLVYISELSTVYLEHRIAQIHQDILQFGEAVVLEVVKDFDLLKAELAKRI